MHNGDEQREGQAFAEEYALFREDVKDRGSHAEISAGDLARFNVKVKREFDAQPRELGVIAQFKDEGRMGILTRCLAVDSLL